MKQSIERFRQGEFLFIMGHPEQLTKPIVKKEFQRKPLCNKIGWLIVDEAHILMPWGKSKFRPAFLELKTLRASVPKLKLLALTATASKASVKEISIGLSMTDPFVVSLAPDRFDFNSFSC